MSGTVLEQVLADLAAEQAAVDALLAPLSDEQWRTPTPAEGWDVAHQVAHLAWTDEAAVLAATDRAGWDQLVAAAVAAPDGFVDDAAAEGARAPGAELLERWRHGRETLVEVLTTLPAGTKLPWFGPPMSAASMATARYMETWAHGLDVAEGLAAAGLGAEPDPHDRVRHVVHLGVRTRGFAYATHGMEPPAEEPRVELTLPGGEVLTYGPDDAAQRVSGSAWDFALLATQRRHRADTDLVAVGDDAEQWLGIAQAFAGPPGGGRAQR
ncbi:TIGR03084 family metal-binding protein [Nocardioides perillae]|uniref:Uncharacterized protein (TIGR03084 family) n=1 Tax=Nocardioides perillae TaxID=1119534 RepID=A0A7Y9RRG2_9ACTN|nr:uncharacterized protein (TIGR03084 family) [Nocardioides perillae]